MLELLLVVALMILLPMWVVYGFFKLIGTVLVLVAVYAAMFGVLYWTKTAPEGDVYVQAFEWALKIGVIALIFWGLYGSWREWQQKKAEGEPK